MRWIDRQADRESRPSFGQWLLHEQEAKALRGYESTLVPGLLQTAEYAGRVLGAQGEDAVVFRLKRQERLTGENPPDPKDERAMADEVLDPGGVMDESGVTIRRAGAADAAKMADVWLRSYAAALPTVRRAHSDEEVRAHFRDVVVPEYEAWVAVTDGNVVGLMVLHGEWVDQLYLHPSWRGRGLGDRLVALAKAQRPDGLQLWTFQVNQSACRFYQRHGFVEVERTDGADNEEHEPDIRYAWHPRSP